MAEYKRVGVDTSKHVFTLHGVDVKNSAVLRRNLRRGAFVEFFRTLPPTEVALEACGGSHHWARELQALGHEVVLIPAQYVKPFVKRGKNDAADAEAICTAAAQPGMARVPVKSAEQQAGAMLLKVRELLVRQRTQLVNALRGHVEPKGSPDAAEFGCAQAQGARGLATVQNELATAPDAAVPEEAKAAFALLGTEIGHVDARLAAVDAELMRQHRSDPDSRRLLAVPGIGPVGALTLTRLVEPGQFRSGRHFAAWLGLVPRERSTGGKQRLGGISRAGNERLRSLLVLGATAVIRHAKPGQAGLHAWLDALLKRRPRKLAAVALANKMARIAWAMMASGEAYRQPAGA